jgi:hypothetical protein
MLMMKHLLLRNNHETLKLDAPSFNKQTFSKAFNLTIVKYKTCVTKECYTLELVGLHNL